MKQEIRTDGEAHKDHEYIESVTEGLLQAHSKVALHHHIEPGLYTGAGFDDLLWGDE